ncbi:peptide chain release factor N(5)-glutamine methyltransferase [bacterium]|nr:peptide chain release factor N(5)-glutamine methyltransferase [bacterium]MCG2677362.1 peptide chain release factor N(5)-glutamine methyltransferase [bacterium]
MNIKEALNRTHRDLRNFLEAEVLLKSCLEIENVELYLNPDRHLSHYELNLLAEAIEKRKNHLPLAYITGEKEFYSLEFRVTPDTFIPRPETEFLVEAVLKKILDPGSLILEKNQHPASSIQHPVNIIDLGTGCGNIAATLARYIPHSKIYATDISKKALGVAKENARRHRVEDRITFLEGDLFSPLENRHLKGKIDFLVSNPPYVIKSEIDSLMPEVANYEPRIALDGGEDGLSFYRRIIEGAAQYLKSLPRRPASTAKRGEQAGQGYLVLELGIDQAPQVKEMIEKTSKFESIEIIKDYSGIERVIVARRAVISNR